MNRKNVGKVLAAFARPGPRKDFNLLMFVQSLAGREVGNDDSAQWFLDLTDDEFKALFCFDVIRCAFDRAASAAVVQILFETGVVDWPLAIARAGLKVAA